MRLLMIMENNSRICCNQPIDAGMKFSFRATSDTVINWIIPNNNKPTKPESLVITFKTRTHVSKNNNLFSIELMFYLIFILMKILLFINI